MNLRLVFRRHLNITYRDCRHVLKSQRFYENVIGGPDEAINKLVAAALARMPDNVLEIFILKKFIELTEKEIAYVCGISKKKVERTYRSGLEEIGRMLTEGTLILAGKDERANA